MKGRGGEGRRGGGRGVGEWEKGRGGGEEEGEKMKEGRKERRTLKYTKCY